MLVLSRRPGERIVFPNLGITLEVVRLKGNVARLGIDAPAGVRILREEVAERPLEHELDHEAAQPQIPHAIRNRLQSVFLAVQLLRRQQEMGRAKDAEALFQRVLSDFEALESELAEMRHVGESDQNHGCRALVVEDDANQCQLLAGLLRCNGIEVATAEDGCDALNYLARNERPDVVLLDMVMPRCGGAKTVEEIRCNPEYSGLKIFAVSGTSPSRFGLTTGPLGVDRWYPKPLNAERLVREIRHDVSLARKTG